MDDMNTRERIGRLHDYLSALAQEVHARPVRHVDGHDLTLAPSDVPAHPSVRLGAAAGQAWLRVARTPRPAPPPDVPETLAPYLEGVPLDDPYLTPASPEDPSVEAAVRAWTGAEWEPWASEARPVVAARRLYETLFRLRQRMRTDEATHELVWGHGVLGWRFGGESVCHPLVFTRVRIGFDGESGDLSVLPDGLPALELDCLQGLGVPDLERLGRVGEESADDPVDVWSPEEARALYRRILAPLGLDARVADGPELPEATEAPVIADTWRLVVRRRRVLFLRFFEQLKRAMADRPVLPAPMVELVGRGDDEPPPDDGEWAAVGERLLLPLAANEEQEQIARKLATHSGVTVQGPPGTGKSHTIANLVSHLVAHGRRVLVTAHKDQALAVLRDKIPDDLRDLSLAVLGSSSAHLTELQRSVQAITAAADAVDEEAEGRTVEALRARLEDADAEVRRLRARLRSGLEREQEELEVAGHRRRAAEVADWLARNEPSLGRIPDPLSPGTACPLTADELTELFALVRRIGPDDALAGTADMPVPGELPPADLLARDHEELQHAREAVAGHDLARVDALGDADLARLADDVERAAVYVASLGEGWIMRLRGQVVQERQWLDLWSAHTDRLWQGVSECASLRRTTAGAHVELPGDLTYHDTVELLERLRRRYAANRKVSSVAGRDLLRFVRAARVDGDPPRTAEDVDRILAHLKLRRLRENLRRLWSEEFVATLSAPPVPEGTVDVETWIDERVRRIGEAVRWETAGWPPLRDRVAYVLPGPVNPAADELRRTAATLRGLRLRFRQRTLQAGFDALRDRLNSARTRPEASPLWGELLDALDAADWARWDAAMATAGRLAALRPSVVRLAALYDRLAEVAPRWAELIRESAGDPVICGEPREIGPLWRWRQAETWLAGIVGADDVAEVQRRLDAAQDEQRRLTLELTRRSAWLGMKRNLGTTQRQALVGWLQTLRKIGKGTGAGANKWRAEAQRLMPQAMGAVPIWIMPYYRVVESFDPLVAPPFDVVVVDESSQCDTFALGLLGLGAKIVVVGDDKQISPSAIGTSRARVDELIRTHLGDVPHPMLLDLESSLYDAAARLFPGVVRLREHFRCLPQIIEFSSRRYYGGEIQPLREETARLPGPAVRAVHVPDGVRRDRAAGDVNEPEAAALVDRLVQCCADPAYEGRTMGVISLLGTSRQAQIIDEALLHKLGPEEYEARRLRCADAYGFQGDERDVVFVSVVADDARSAATSRGYEQRMNVAASRARDQLWVFHSVLPGELHPADERAALIRYALDGGRSAEPPGDLEARCESDFERRVLRMLLARGYAVSPQHRVGGLRIDLVVHGGGRRLAIECDGDKYHGPDQWDADLRRQRVLERLGWRFWRVRGSAFYRDPNAALDPLWPLLDELGVTPA
jgi:very-short-patch-repair endonuclease